MSFTNPETLKRHQSFYCKEVSRQSLSSSFELENKTQKTEIINNNEKKRKDCPVINDVMKTIFKRKIKFFIYQKISDPTILNNELKSSQANKGIKHKISTDLSEINNLIVLPVAYHNQSDKTLIQVIFRIFE